MAQTRVKAGMIDVPVNAQTGTSYTYLATDRGKLVTHANASAIAATLPQATGTFGAGFALRVKNVGAGLVTITPTTSTVNGNATLLLPTGASVDLISDGTNWLGVGNGASSRVGEFIWYFGDAPPAHALECDGAAVSRTTYARLWAFAGASGLLAASEGAKEDGEFGPGDGSTTFTLPDLVTVGRFVRSTYASLAAGKEQADATAVNGLSAATTATSNAQSLQPNTGGAHDLSRGPAAGAVTISSTDTETRPHNIALLPCVIFE